jgi:hypothetical protein
MRKQQSESSVAYGENKCVFFHAKKIFKQTTRIKIFKKIHVICITQARFFLMFLKKADLIFRYVRIMNFVNRLCFRVHVSEGQIE